MQWVSAQVQQFYESPQYLDTAVIPCYRIDLFNRDLEHVKANEQVMMRLMDLEDRLKGRLILFPACVFYDTVEQHINSTIEVTSNALQQFNYVIYVPFDQALHDIMQTITYKENEQLFTEEMDWYQAVLASWNKKVNDL